MRNILEQDEADKFKSLKSLVESKIVYYVDDCKDIKYKIQSTLSEFNEKYNMVGWVRSDTQYTLSNIVNKYIDDQILSGCYGLADTLTTKLDKMLHFQNVIKKVRRIINIYFLEENLIEVRISDFEEYYHHSNKYLILFDATKQQAESYDVNKLKLNNVNYISQYKKNLDYIEDNGSFDYQVSSDEILLDEPISKIEYNCSYTSYVDDFYISYRLHSPCYEFNVTVSLDNSNDRYSILCSTFSSTERIQQSDYTDYEWHTRNICDIKFPIWSLPGSGYTITLKRKK